MFQEYHFPRIQTFIEKSLTCSSDRPFEKKHIWLQRLNIWYQLDDLSTYLQSTPVN